MWTLHFGAVREAISFDRGRRLFTCPFGSGTLDKTTLAINNIDENNRARDRLLLQLQTRRLVGCTGAGLSVWAGYRLWPGVIRRLADEVKRRRPGEVNTDLILRNHGADLLLCAQRLGSELGEAAFSEFIRTEFGPTGTRPHEAVLRIAALPLRHTLTLNFDTSYEIAHGLIGEQCQTISSRDRLSMARFLRDMEDPQYPKTAVHLHGKYDDNAQEIALAEQRYDLLYRRDPFFSHFVWSMASKRLLFLGFGFTDYDFTAILRACARDVQGNGFNHFGLVGVRPEGDDDQIRAYLNGRYLVDPVFYDIALNGNNEENHDEFAATINGISIALGMRQPAVPPPVPPIQPVPPVLDPEDQRRADELNRRVLERIEPGGGGV